MKENHEEELVGHVLNHHLRNLSFNGGDVMIQGAMMRSGTEYESCCSKDGLDH